jgi:hypothetical protein
MNKDTLSTYRFQLQRVHMKNLSMINERHGSVIVSYYGEVENASCLPRLHHATTKTCAHATMITIEHTQRSASREIDVLNKSNARGVLHRVRM